MRKEITFTIILLLALLVLPASAEIFREPEDAPILYSGDGVCPMDTLFGSALAISPGEHLQESALIRLDSGGRLYLQCRNLTESLAGLHLSVQGDAPIYQGTLGGTSWIYLGNFPAGTEERLYFILTVPQNLSDQGRLDWQNLSWRLLTELPNTPATGDKTHPEAALGVLTLSTLGLLATGWMRKKRLL